MWPFIELSEVHCGGVWGHIFITELYSNGGLWSGILCLGLVLSFHLVFVGITVFTLQNFVVEKAINSQNNRVLFCKQTLSKFLAL